MFVRPKVRAAAAVAASTAVLAAVMVPLAHADPAAELQSSFDEFAKTLPGSVQLAVAAAGSKDAPLVLKSSATSSPSAPSTADSQPVKGRTRCTQVFHIGDSTSEAIDRADYIPNEADRATAQYKRVGVEKMTLDATNGRSIIESVNGNPNALDGISTLLEKGATGCWVIAMGVNDVGNIASGAQGSGERIAMVMDKLKGQEVLWPTITTTTPANPAFSKANMDKFNAAIKAAAAKYPNLKVYDFAAQAKPEWTAGDGIHYTTAGAVARNKMIADALAAEFPAQEPAPQKPASAGSAEADQTPAWGSIRVPIALAAARAQSTGLEKVTAAIADSNSVAATELWKELGAHPGKKVTEVLAELGAKGTKVAGDPGTSYEDLAKTVWPVADQAAFGAGLLCAPDRSLVTSAMMQAPAGDNGRWGLQDASGKPGVQFAAAHGGWGPIGTAAYSARQFGLLQTSKGLMSVSISGLADSASRDDAVSIVTAATEWLTKNLDGLPAGFCSPSDQASASSGTGSASSTSAQSSEPSTSAEPSSEPSATTEPSSEQSPAETTPVEAGAETSTATSSAEPSTTSSAEPSPTESPSTSPSAEPVKSATPLAAPDSTCTKTVVALDPGHNGVHIEPFDPVTGAKMVDDPNGEENFDAFTVAKLVAQKLGAAGGYNVVILKDKPMANVSYRDRVSKAEQAGAVMGVSIHTSPGDNAVFPQRVGLFRQGPAEDGSSKKVTFTVENVASRSALFSGKFARARSSVEGTRVQVRDNTFDGRAPLWSGNIPIISLISNKVPWVYNEFGPASGGGGANKIADSDLQTYADGLVAGIKASAPGKTCG